MFNQHGCLNGCRVSGCGNAALSVCNWVVELSSEQASQILPSQAAIGLTRNAVTVAIQAFVVTG